MAQSSKWQMQRRMRAGTSRTNLTSHSGRGTVDLGGEATSSSQPSSTSLQLAWACETRFENSSMSRDRTKLRNKGFRGERCFSTDVAGSLTRDIARTGYE